MSDMWRETMETLAKDPVAALEVLQLPDHARKALNEIARLEAENKQLLTFRGLPSQGAIYLHAIKTITELQAIVATLFKTEDNVTIVPGMTLWYRSPAGLIETPILDSWAEIEGTIAEDEFIGPVLFFSTRKALEANPE